MSLSLSLLFYIKKSKADSSGKTNIYLRITLDGHRSEFSIHRKTHVDWWNSKSQLAMGNSPEVQNINQHLSILRNKVYSIQQNFERENETYTATDIRDVLLGKDKTQKMLLEIFQEHNEKVESLIGKDFSAGTAERYRTCKKHVASFIKKKYKKNDIPVQDVDHTFITGFEYYLKTTRKCAHNSAIKYITNFKKIIRIAHANDWIDKDPFLHWKGKLKIVEREFLTEEEIQKIIELELKMERLDQVRDIFIFCCFTGLAYADVKKLNGGDISVGADGEEWVKTKRSKTDTRSNIPILPIAKVIVEKYKDNELLKEKDLVLPVLSNQKMNAYIKEIATLAGITKNLTFHLARHTFATTVTLTNGVPIESVSKMLGHTNLKTTQHYAKILDMKVSKDMAILRSKFK
ncbi:site-specific integrase [Leeuwenhoekiella marinoflava]|uniref:Site-specific recombinase XerD n=2 Tax=Leeuwenhoekiella marinoflava TaxID=988 RepID=A0A4Q0PLU1_9FLAO|nr:site-specific integrase [Leeuwenhoekiella marinoflava]RXG30677.1 site-specific recombinase XerD [Leeuwenhoekiella marinoflava]SHF19948.1 Site-specific recombinase XerD [Leeuwenhoekiella marinoflava DSM 3653]